MTNGLTSSLARSSRIRSACFGSTFGARHMRGLEEKIWKVLAPIFLAHSTAFDAPPAAPRCTPIRLAMRTVYDYKGGAMSKLFEEMAQGTAEARAYMDGKRKG